MGNREGKMVWDDISIESVKHMSYVDLISLVDEANRPPGGKRTVRRWIDIARVDSSKHVLEIGSNTGFTSLELARVARCRVTGVDVSKAAVTKARGALSRDVKWVQDSVRFEVGDARNLTYEDSTFDVVVCGGALSFIVERGRALSEIVRVLVPWGFVCVSPLFYREAPPSQLIDDLSAELGFPIPVWSSRDWERFFVDSGLELYHVTPVPLNPQPETRVREFVQLLSSKPHLPGRGEIRKAVQSRLNSAFSLFNENHRYLGFLLGILRKRACLEEMELFLADPVAYP